ncbi:glycoside hydrolase family 75 protein [Lojkania enalia]|uniref:Endo-chitosanase n=1 Tax=Lojkania enalia TaxID=147567 RepID=A0A9P4N2W2_9PLEO|nr:glycoside hydrolase family 75 protein [Didymosphaeria enalia]
MRSTIASAVFFASLVSTREIPANLQAFFDAHKNGPCPNAISIPYNSGQGEGDTVYCKDNASGAIYLKDNANGYADVDIDCDGLNADKGDCFNDPTGQSQTAFKNQVQAFGIEDLDSHIHTYVVLGNDNSAKEGNGGMPFDPATDANVKPLSVVVVVCNDQLFYGVWGDVNGGIVTGESSLSLGQMCFPDGEITGNNGHSDHDVLYIAFEGDDAVPGATANWKAATREEFEASLAPVGDLLVRKLGGGSLDSNGTVKSRVMRARV